jgi:hypothetical protein
MSDADSGAREKSDASKPMLESDIRIAVKTIPGWIAAVGGIAAMANLIAVFVHRQASLEIATLASVPCLLIIAFVWQRLKRYRPKGTSAWAVVLVLGVALALGTLGGLGIASAIVALRHAADSGSGSGSPEAGCAQAVGGPEQGRILLPFGSATNIPVGNILTGYGTIRGLPAGHHLLLFLRADDSSSYMSGDTVNSMVCGGAWSLNIYVDGGVPVHTAFTLFLVDLGPSSWAYVTSPAELSLRQNGFASATPGSDARILCQTQFVSYATG